VKLRIFVKTIAWAGLLLALAGGSLLISQDWSGRSGDPSAAVQPVEESLRRAPSRTPVEVQPVKIGRIRETVRAVGTLQANESVIVRPEIPGVVKRILFVEGQPVSKGAVLVELDGSELQAEVDQAQAELKMATLTYDRMKQLVGNQNAYVSQQQIDQAVSALAMAGARHTMYLTRLAKTKVRAAFAGHVGIRRISLGDYVQTGQDLVNLEDLSTLKIDFKVPETYLNRLAVGQGIEVETDAYPERTFTGRVYALDPRIDAASRAVHLRAGIANVEEKLRPGLFVNLDLMFGENSHALLIPEEAVVHQREKTFIYRIVGDTARLSEVTLGTRERGLVHVVSGVDEEDRVVAVGHHKLKDGAPVQPVGGPSAG
jgi:membrane fusion protein, multidrug efflux system